MILSLWLFGMIFPLNWLRDNSATLRYYFDGLFAAEWVHIIGHIFLFGGLALLLVHFFELRLERRTVILLAVIILAVGGLQEYFQMQTKGLNHFRIDEYFDLIVDLTGGALAWGILQLRQHKQINQLGTGPHKI